MAREFIVLNYTADLSGSTVALLRLLERPGFTNKFLLVASPQSHALKVAEEKNWPHLGITVPLLRKSLSPIYWWRYLTGSLRLGRALRHLIEAHRAKYLLVNCSVNLGWTLGWSPLKDRPKVLWLIHELEIRPAWAHHWIKKRVEANASMIFGVSRPVQERFTRPVHLLPNCVSTGNKQPVGDPFGAPALSLLWVGTVTPRKGLHQLPELAKAFSSLGLPFRLEVVATVTPNQQDYFKTCLRKIREINEFSKTNLELAVRTDVTDINTIYGPEKILINNSRLPESFNLVALEAMSRGMLIFCNSGGGINDFGAHRSNLIFLDKLEENLLDVLKELKSNRLVVTALQKNAWETAKAYSPEKTERLFWEALNTNGLR